MRRAAVDVQLAGPLEQLGLGPLLVRGARAGVAVDGLSALSRSDSTVSMAESMRPVASLLAVSETRRALGLGLPGDRAGAGARRRGDVLGGGPGLAGRRSCPTTRVVSRKFFVEPVTARDDGGRTVVPGAGERALEAHDAGGHGGEVGLEAVEVFGDRGGSAWRTASPDLARDPIGRTTMTSVTSVRDPIVRRHGIVAHRTAAWRRSPARLRTLRDELAIVDEQLAQLGDDADDLALRALVSETPSALVRVQRRPQARRRDAPAPRPRRRRDRRAGGAQDDLLDRMTS